MFDIILENGRVVDGTGLPWYCADVAIKGERIAAIGNLAKAEAETRIDVRNRVISPGFIDTHVHGDLALLDDPKHECAIHQGVTTYILGQDGCGFAPVYNDATFDHMRRYTAGFTGDHSSVTIDWNSVDDYLNRFDKATSLNVAYLVPNGTVRMEVMGLETRPPTSDEIRQMQHLIAEGLDHGAVGLSTGLDYIPSLYANAEELGELCKMLTPVDGVYVTHYRAHGGTKTHEAIDEVYEIGRRSGCLLHISHFNVPAAEYLHRIDEGRTAGVDITYDTYPYIAGMTFLAMFALPGEIQVGGVDATLERLQDQQVREQVHQWLKNPRFQFDRVNLAHVAAEDYKEFEGISVLEASERAGLPLGSFVCDIILKSHFNVSAVVFMSSRTEQDIAEVMTHPCHMGGSDGIFSGSMTHPRGWGAFARFLGPYVREGKWRLEEAVAHLSSHAARRYRLPDRGLVQKGLMADLVVFDPAGVNDVATYENPRQLATGVDHVFVGGKQTLKAGKHTGVLNGRALRRA